MLRNLGDVRFIESDLALTTEIKMDDKEILEIADRFANPEFIERKPEFVNRARIAFGRAIEAATLERAAKVCEERGERNRIANGKPNGDRDEFYCADDIRRLIR